MTGYPAELEEHWTAGGEVLLIRPIRPSDAAQHDAFFHRLTPEDIRSRFFAAVRDLTPVQGRGLATHLMQRLLDWAPQHGVREVVGEILADNTAMLELARHLGFRLGHLPEDSQIIEARLSLAAPKETAAPPV